MSATLAEKAQWTSQYINSLSDSAFAIVLTGGSKDDTGRTTPRSLRKLPHHDSAGALDRAHVLNGLSRAPQMTDVTAAQRERAVSHLQKHFAALGKAAEHEHEPPPDVDPLDLTIAAFRALAGACGADLES